MAEQLRQALHDGQAKSEALGAVALRVADLLELLQTRLRWSAGMPTPVSSTSIRRPPSRSRHPMRMRPDGV